MRLGFSVISCLLFVLAVLSPTHVQAQSDVLTLTDANFDHLTAHGTWLVEFYAPWCGHCQKLAPIYEQVGTKLKGIVNVAKMDSVAEKVVPARFNVKSYPTIKLIHQGQSYSYGDARTVEAFYAWATGGYKSVVPEPLPSASAEAGDAQEESTFDRVKKVAGAAAGAAAAAAGAAASSDSSSDVVVLTKANFDALTSKGAWLLEFYAPWCGHCKSLAPIYEKVATALKGKVNVGKVDCVAEPDLGTRFSVKGYPTIKFLKDGVLYDYNKPRTLESFSAFAEGGFKESGVTSAQLPAAVAAAGTHPTAAPVSDVIILTDANFDEKTALGDWLVEFYAPWCGHCKRLKPIYDEVAIALKGKVNVAKVDCTTEPGVCNQHDIRGYPTIYYFHNGQRYNFEGDRTVAGFKTFVQSGWEKVKAEPLPGPRSAIKETLLHVVQSFENLFSNNLYLVIAGCLGVGVLFGIIIVVLTAPPPARPPRNNNNAQQQPQQQQQQRQQQPIAEVDAADGDHFKNQ